MRVVKRPGAAAQVAARFTRVTLAGAEGGAEALSGKLSGPGSGRQYVGLPNRSSAEREYPAEQFGGLLESIGAKPLEGIASGFGSIDGPEYVAALHFKPPDAGGRPFLDDALYDRDVHGAVLNAIREEVT